MGIETGISWCDATWNPWMGCRKVSAGCKNCYAEKDALRYGKDFKSIVRSKTTFRNPQKWWNLKVDSKIFTCSISDFFIEEADVWRKEAWEIIKNTPFTYLILTKRPERMLECLPDDWNEGYKNVWLGVSAENQEYADKRIPILLSIPSIVHFISIEPMLSKINLRFPKSKNPSNDVWVIVGGESGFHARSMDINWAMNIKDQCNDAGVAFFMKQLSQKDFPKTFRDFNLFPSDLQIREYPKQKEGIL
jgi:protein gp37